MSKEDGCGWGHTVPISNCDACDEWTDDDDTGWGGFTDHYLGVHFNDEEERTNYIRKHGYAPIREEDTK